MNRLSGKNAIVTGATSGIGEAIARLLSAEGATVAVIGRRKDEGEKVVLGIGNEGGKAFYVEADVSNPKLVENMIKLCVAKFSKIDILVNNAGVTTGNVPIEYLSEEDWDKVMNTNAKGTFLCSKAVIPHMKNGGGSIVNISSVGGLKSYVGGSAYSSSKAAVIMLTKTTATEYGKYGIRANCICPGSTDTEMFEEGIKSGLARSGAQNVSFEQIVGNITRGIPLGRLGTPKDMANMVVFLASEEAAYINGAVIVVDGGQSV